MNETGRGGDGCSAPGAGAAQALGRAALDRLEAQLGKRYPDVRVLLAHVSPSTARGLMHLAVDVETAMRLERMRGRSEREGHAR